MERGGLLGKGRATPVAEMGGSGGRDVMLSRQFEAVPCSVLAASHPTLERLCGPSSVLGTLWGESTQSNVTVTEEPGSLLAGPGSIWMSLSPHLPLPTPQTQKSQKYLEEDSVSHNRKDEAQVP